MDRSLPHTALALAAGALAAAAALGPASATAGPEEEAHTSVYVGYPGFFGVLERSRQRVVARIDIEHISGPSTVPLKVCVSVNSLTHPTVTGRRQRVRISNGGSTICWREPALSRGQKIRAVVRADIPDYAERHSITETTIVELYAFDSDTVAEERSGGLKIRPRPRPR